MSESAKRTILHTATLDFGAVSANADLELTAAIIGVELGDVVAVSAPSLEAGLIATAYVSGVEEATVRLSNVTGAPVNPASQNFLLAITH